MRTLTILDPTARPRSRVERVPGPLESLRGKTVAILNNRWKAMDLVAERFETRLKREQGAAEVLQRVIPISAAAPAELLEEVAARAEVAVVGLAN